MNCRASVAVVLVGVMCAATPSAGADPAADVRAQLTAFAQAYRNADVAAIDRMLTADYVQTNGGSAPTDRDGYLDWNRKRAVHFADGSWRLDRYELSELAIVMYGDDAAVATARVTASGARDGAAWTSDVRMTNLWVLEDGTWRRAAFHDSHVSAE